MSDPVILDSLTGHVHGVYRVTAGHTLAVAASIGDTVLYMADTSDYDEAGGQVLVSGDVYDYTGIDPDAETLTLATPLTVAAAYEDPVDVFDPEVGGMVVVGYEASVLLDDADPTGRTITVDVQHGLVPMLEESTRGGPGEAVTLVRDGEHDWTIWQVDGKLAVDLLADAAVESAALAFDLATLAMTEAELAQATADGKIDTYYQTTAPSSGMGVGDLWFDTDDNKAWRYSGTAWVSVQDVAVVQALSDAQSAQTTADGKIVHFVQAGTPTAEGYGDIWTETDADNKKWWWNGGSWVALLVGDDAINTILTGKTIRTSSGSSRLQMRDDSQAGILEAYVGGSLVGYINPWSGGWDINGEATFGNDVHASAFMYVAGQLHVTSEAHFYAQVYATGAVHGNTLWSDVDAGGASSGADIGPDGKVKRSTSTRRDKKNIRKAEVDVPGLRTLVAKVFKRKDENDGPEYLGLIAEEVAEAGFDHLVFHDAEGRVDGIHFNALTVALLVGWQEQQAQIDALTARVEALEG